MSGIRLRQVWLIVACVAMSMGGSANAAEVVNCTGNVGVTGIGFPANPTIAGSCTKGFTLLATTEVILTLTASPEFNGPLRMHVSSVKARLGIPLDTTFIAGTAVNGPSSKPARLPAADDWRLTVETKGGICFFQIPPLPGCAPGVNSAVGAFRGTVTTA